MCLLIYSPHGHIPASHRRIGLVANPHGWGYAFARRGKIVMRHGLLDSAERASWEADHVNGPVIWHARIATHGSVGLDNCHPFRVPGHPLVVGHNGIISECGSDKKRSDTRTLCEDVLAGLSIGWESNQSTLRMLGAFIGWSKLAILRTDGEVTLVNEHMGHWRKGIWYSNSSYRPAKTSPMSFMSFPVFGK